MTGVARGMAMIATVSGVQGVSREKERKEEPRAKAFCHKFRYAGSHVYPLTLMGRALQHGGSNERIHDTSSSGHQGGAG